MEPITRKPEWVPDSYSEGFASQVVMAQGMHDGSLVSHKATAQKISKPIRRQLLSIDDYVEGILSCKRAIIGRAITLIESNAHSHMETAQTLLRHIMPHTGKAIRIGVTGVPGVGKSTFIETFGSYLIEQGKRLAVLAIDPSSCISGGSILGDKTRMEKLSRNDKCFIRPSPSGGTLGGVARKTRESMLVCEAAGFDVIIVETVGVGQSEFTVRSMVDFFLLLMLAGAGDELQGIKRGIMELADAILINKADGDNKVKAEFARNEYERSLHYIKPISDHWTPGVFTCSAMENSGISDIWSVIESYWQKGLDSGYIIERRQAQTLNWMREMIDDHLKSLFYSHPTIENQFPKIEALVLSGNLPPSAAVKELIDLWHNHYFNHSE